jgi:hypothetical protein
MKEKSYNYGINILELCEAKCGYVSNLWLHAGIEPTYTEQNTAFNVANKLCQKIKNKGHTIYVNRLAILDQL